MVRAVGLLALVVSLSGCGSLISRPHDTGLVEQLGLEEAEQELIRVSKQATSPEITDVAVHEGWFRLTGGFNFYRKLDIYYENLSRLELYDSGAVFMYGADRILGKVFFGSAATATRWCDLVSSLKAFHHENVSLDRGDDGFEENDTRWTAPELELGVYEGVRLWDLDWYQVSLVTGETFTARVTFEPTSHEVELALYDDAGDQLAAAEGDRGAASLRVQAGRTGPVYVRVSAKQEGATYTLELR